jgi:hypothetical protein
MKSTGALQGYIRGFYRDYAKDNAPEGFKLAPLTPIDSTLGGYLYRKNDLRYDARKSYEGTLDSDFQRSSSTIEAVSVATKNFKSSFEVIPQQVISTIDAQSGISLVQSTVRGLASQIHGGFVNELVASATAGLASDTINLSTDSIDIWGEFESACQSIQAAAGERPNVIYMSPAAYARIIANDQLQGGTSVSGFTSAGSAVRRTGFPVASFAYDWFLTRLNLELVVENTTGLNSSGTGAFVLGNSIILAHAAPGAERSCFKTVHMPMDNGGLVQFIQSPSVLPNPPGVAVAAQAQYKVEVTEPALGVIYTATLS